MLTFSWSPVQPNCYSIAYKITSENCGECPTLTHNTSVNCIIITNHTNAALDQMCTFSIQSVVCGNSTGNASTSVTAKLKGITIFPNNSAIQAGTVVIGAFVFSKKKIINPLCSNMYIYIYIYIYIVQNIFPTSLN